MNEKLKAWLNALSSPLSSIIFSCSQPEYHLRHQAFNLGLLCDGAWAAISGVVGRWRWRRTGGRRRFVSIRESLGGGSGGGGGGDDGVHRAHRIVVTHEARGRCCWCCIAVAGGNERVWW